MHRRRTLLLIAFIAFLPLAHAHKFKDQARVFFEAPPTVTW